MSRAKSVRLRDSGLSVDKAAEYAERTDRYLAELAERLRAHGLGFRGRTPTRAGIISAGMLMLEAADSVEWERRSIVAASTKRPIKAHRKRGAGAMTNRRETPISVNDGVKAFSPDITPWFMAMTSPPGTRLAMLVSSDLEGLAQAVAVAELGADVHVDWRLTRKHWAFARDGQVVGGTSGEAMVLLAGRLKEAT